MNQADISTLSITKKSSNRKRKILRKIVPSIKQNFSFLIPIIRYIAEHPSTPEAYIKLAQSCKYFFEKNPILIVKCIHENGRKICSNAYADSLKQNHKCCVKINIKKITSKIWLTGRLAYYHIKDITSLLYPKIYRCENVVLEFWQDKVAFEDFKLSSSIFKHIFLFCAKIIEKDEKQVTLEKIVESLPNAQTLIY